jgi:DNA-binding GntR family transcriptional regulator
VTDTGKSVERGVGLARQVHAALTERIAEGKIGPHERLVVERVAAELGVSPTPVREAINRLLQDGLVEDAPNGRIRIVRLTPDYVVNTFMVRAALEGLAAELAAPRVQSDHISALGEAMGQIEAAAKRGEYEVFSSLDDSLHQIIREAAGNPVLSRELRPLQIHIGLIYAYVNRTYSREQLAEYVQRSHEEHMHIVEVLADRKPRMARGAVEKHIRDAGERYANLIRFSNEHPEIGSSEETSRQADVEVMREVTIPAT